MKLLEALKTVTMMRQRKGPPLRCFLAAGFTPLHLKTFLAAEMSRIFTERPIEVLDGLYGDLLGNIARAAESESEAGIVCVEWPDLDPRLGVRNGARWSPIEREDILGTVKKRALEIQNAIEKASARVPVVLCLPTLPLPPIAHTPSWQASMFATELRTIIDSLSLTLVSYGQIRILDSQRLDLDSPYNDRQDIESELQSGFPYRLTHASILAGLFARLVQRPIPKKGLITDLDDTLWNGILGEVGIEGISWDLEHNSQMHAVYQRFLGALMGEGVMVGVASKNDPSLGELALRRDDLALSAAGVFPVEINWGAKSESVSRILDTWNVGADSVVFIDDSPLELAEVKAAHPLIECLQFPTNESTAIYGLIRNLRDLFGRSAISEEDSIRIENVRRSRAAANTQTNGTVEDFLEGVKAEMSFDFSKARFDSRAFDLVNKTNQFNLNGNRYSEASWKRLLDDPESFLMVVSYRDKFGPLGKIGVLAGTRTDRRLVVKTWVMSCRAFSRRVEHRCLAELVSRLKFEKIEFEYCQTERNAPLRDFLSNTLQIPCAGSCMISQADLESRLGLVLRPQEVSHG
jgi:FkbH-like protein